MLEELKLHIGVHKTGTSATQMMVSKLLSSGENDNIIYPKTGLLENWPFAHHTLCNELHLGDDKILFDLKEEVLNSGNKTCLISCEDFSNYSSINLIFQISTALCPQTTSIYIVLRNYYEYLQSYYLERIKRGEFYSDFETFILHEGAHLSFSNKIKLLRYYPCQLNVRIHKTSASLNLAEELIGSPISLEKKEIFKSWGNHTNKSLSIFVTELTRNYYLSHHVGDVSNFVNEAYIYEEQLSDNLPKLYLYNEKCFRQAEKLVNEEKNRLRGLTGFTETIIQDLTKPPVINDGPFNGPSKSDQNCFEEFMNEKLS